MTFVLAQAESAAGGSPLFSLLLILIPLWFLMSMPARKQMKARKAVQDAIAVGDPVQTAGGIMGTIVQLDDDSVVLELESGRIRIARRAIVGREAS